MQICKRKNHVGSMLNSAFRGLFFLGDSHKIIYYELFMYEHKKGIITYARTRVWTIKVFFCMLAISLLNEHLIENYYS